MAYLQVWGAMMIDLSLSACVSSWECSVKEEVLALSGNTSSWPKLGQSGNVDYVEQPTITI